MARTKTMKLALVVIALIAALALAVGCASSSTSGSSASGSKSSASSASAASVASASSAASAATLEEYFAKHQDEWDAIVKPIKESAGSIMDVDISISGNQINMVLTYTETYSDEAVERMRQSLEEQSDSMKSSVGSDLKQLERQYGFTGLTWHTEYRNGDGKLITEIDVSSAE